MDYNTFLSTYSTKHPQLKDWFNNDKFPILFKTDGNKTRLWGCWVDDDTVFRTDGFVNGKLKEPQKHTFAGNTLRSPEEQAQLEAEKLWIKQTDKGYEPLENTGVEIYKKVKEQQNQNGGMNRGVKMFGETMIKPETTAGNVSTTNTQHKPMLAKKYKEYNKQGELEISTAGRGVQFPCLVQAKVDGIRAIAYLDTQGQVVLESRNGNYFVHLNHIRSSVKDFLSKHPTVVLDGELYLHNLYKDGKQLTNQVTHDICKSVERYQFISEACKITRTKPHDNEIFVEYWLFDVWDLQKTNLQRQDVLKQLFSQYSNKFIRITPTITANTHQDIEEFMKKMTGEGTRRFGYEFEGVMIRQSTAKYSASTTHSNCLLKYKRFQDDEWAICGAEKCVGGIQDGAVVWICKKTLDGKKYTVKAKQMGDVEKAKKMYNDFVKQPPKFMGKMLNIRYNETTKDNVPRFPRATAIVQDK